MSTVNSLPIGRQRLATVLRESGNLVRIDDAARILSFDRPSARRQLSRWNQQGWMRRVGPGIYTPVDYASLGGELVLDDSWILVPHLFGPAYIGTRTALHYWELTDQLFNDTVILTVRPVRSKYQVHHNLHYTVKHIKKEKLFGTEAILRGKRAGEIEVLISDLERTIVDSLDDPEFSGGILFVFECLFNYFMRKDRDDEKLITYAERLGNGAVFKRLGFLAEPDPKSDFLVDACKARLTQGYVQLETQIPSKRLVSRWRLFVPDLWLEQHPFDKPR